MRDLEHAKLMLKLAQNDLNALRVLKESEKISSGVFGFHAQQSVEKSLKSWLSLLGIAYPKIHILHVLFDMLKESGAPEIEKFRFLQNLTPFGIQYRYEEYDSEEILDKEEIIDEINGLIEHITGLIRKAG